MGILVLQRRAAGGTIHQYGIHITARKQLQGLFDDGHRGFPVSRQKDRKAAASLVLGNDDLDAHLGEHVDHRIADVAEDEVRGAAVEIENLRPRLSRFGGHNLGNRLRKGLFVERRNAIHRKSARLDFGFDPGSAEVSTRPAAQRRRLGHQPLIGQNLEHDLLSPVDPVFLLGPPADAGKEMVSVHAAGAVGHAGTAEQAGGEERLLYLLAQIQLFLDKGPGELDLAAGAGHLQELLLVHRTMGQTESASDAMIDVFARILAQQCFVFHIETIPLFLLSALKPRPHNDRD